MKELQVCPEVPYNNDDIIKCCLDPTVTLPQFYAVDLSRLPPADVKNINMSSVLKELKSLRAEMRELQNPRHEMESLTQEMEKSRASSHTLLPEKDNRSTIRPSAFTEWCVDFP